MSRRLRVAPAAEAELEDAADWHFEQDPELALDFLAAVQQTLDRIMDGPERGLPVLGA